ncbi:MAG: VOC family protein [Chloroflexi bacterium]|nr:MAG: VOC family protein [Chloroflexota bacterium]
MSEFRVQHIDHVAITVSDIARSRDWYREVLGLERRFEDEWGDVPTMMCAGDTCVALFPAPVPGAKPAPVGEMLSMSHFAFRVDRQNFERARENFRQLSVDIRFADHGASHSVYIYDPDGHQIEITTYEI